MTLNDVIALILLYFTEFDFLQARYITVIEDRPILSAEYRLPLWPKLAHLAVRPLSAIAELLVFKTLYDIWEHR